MLIENVKNLIKKFNLIEPDDKIIVGVSGGPDSVALLYILQGLSKQIKFSLYAAHLNHKLRKDSDKDVRFVRNLCDRLKVGLAVKEIDIKKIAKKGSIEEISRNERLKFFIETCQAIKANKIALGHNLDDQAETVLMRLIRGSGLYGLSAILPKREFNHFYIIRPLLQTKRKEIEAFLKKKKITLCMDKTNLKDIYFRNKIRNRLLPLLEKEYNKNIKEILSHSARIIGDDYDYLIRQVEKIIKHNKNNFNLDRFLKLHPAMQRLVLRLIIARLKQDTRAITSKHIEEIQDLAKNRPVHSIVDLPKGIAVIKKKTSLYFYRKTPCIEI